MKTLKYTLIAFISMIALYSCGGGLAKEPATAEGFAAIENDIKTKFGNDAYYTDVSIIFDKSIGNMISVTVTKDPESLQMAQWNSSQGNWKQNSEITVEVPKGSKAVDFMFQLDDKISLTKLGELVEKSVEKLKAEKNLENPTLSIAHIKFPKNGDLSKTEYSINLKPENGGTTFSFYYKLDGELIKMDY